MLFDITWKKALSSCMTRVLLKSLGTGASLTSWTRYNQHIQRRRENQTIKLIQKIMRFQDVLCKLGDVWYISDDLVTDLEEFTCDMYRYSILKQK